MSLNNHATLNSHRCNSGSTKRPVLDEELPAFALRHACLSCACKQSPAKLVESSCSEAWARNQLLCLKAKIEETYGEKPMVSQDRTSPLALAPAASHTSLSTSHIGGKPLPGQGRGSLQNKRSASVKALLPHFRQSKLDYCVDNSSVGIRQSRQLCVEHPEVAVEKRAPAVPLQIQILIDRQATLQREVEILKAQLAAKTPNSIDLASLEEKVEHVQKILTSRADDIEHTFQSNQQRLGAFEQKISLLKREFEEKLGRLAAGEDASRLGALQASFAEKIRCVSDNIVLNASEMEANKNRLMRTNQKLSQEISEIASTLYCGASQKGVDQSNGRRNLGPSARDIEEAHRPNRIEVPLSVFLRLLGALSELERLRRDHRLCGLTQAAQN